MLTNNQKRLLEYELHAGICQTGINTRVLAKNVEKKLKLSKIVNLNLHHVYGMLGYVINRYDHQYLIKTPGHSIIT